MNGQAKIDFEKWLFFNHRIQLLDGFTHLTKSCQNAVIIEWFDSFGITVDTIPRIIDNKVFFEPNTFCLNPEIITEDFEKFKTRQEATEKAIEKAVGIYNNLKTEKR